MMTIRNARFNTFTRIGARCALVATGALAAVACTVGQGTVAEPEGTSSQSSALTWNQDFFDDFNGSSLDGNNWQDQILWVNNELQCYDNGYNENGQHKTVDVSNSTLNLRVINTGVVSNCNNWDKYGNQHPPTQYRGGRVATKNRKEFNQGRWTARLKLYSWTYGGGYGQASGLAGMFPAWWVLGARNNEAPVQEGDENVCWPMPGSSEIDIMEHFGNSGANGFGARPIQYMGGGCNSGNWQNYNHALGSDLSNFHEYQLEVGNDVIFRIDNNQVASNGGVGGNYNEPMFAILNYAI
ncbi:MAG TPA: hypothetical protein VGY54_15915, partial [Polyangiaceae bacterium]|nr:hypothetical protein [Polyangiaceae bacterium]